MRKEQELVSEVERYQLLNSLIHLNTQLQFCNQTPGEGLDSPFEEFTSLRGCRLGVWILTSPLLNAMVLELLVQVFVTCFCESGCLVRIET